MERIEELRECLELAKEHVWGGRAVSASEILDGALDLLDSLATPDPEGDKPRVSEEQFRTAIEGYIPYPGDATVRVLTQRLNAALAAETREVAGGLVVPAQDEKPVIDTTNLITQVTPEIGVYPAPAAPPAAAPAETLIRCNDCKGTLIYKKTDEGYEVFHSCKDGNQVREMFAAAVLKGVKAGCNAAMRGLTEQDVAEAYQRAPNWKAVASSLAYRLNRALNAEQIAKQAMEQP